MPVPTTTEVKQGAEPTVTSGIGWSVCETAPLAPFTERRTHAHEGARPAGASRRHLRRVDLDGLEKETALPRTGPFPHTFRPRLYSPRRVPNNHDDSRAAGRSSAGGPKRETLGHRAERSDGLRWRKPRAQGADEDTTQGRVNANPGHRGYRSSAPRGSSQQGKVCRGR